MLLDTTKDGLGKDSVPSPAPATLRIYPAEGAPVQDLSLWPVDKEVTLWEIYSFVRANAKSKYELSVEAEMELFAAKVRERDADLVDDRVGPDTPRGAKGGWDSLTLLDPSNFHSFSSNETTDSVVIAYDPTCK